MELFRQASILNPQDALIFYYIGLASERLARTQEAVKAYRTAYKLNPAMKEARAKLMELTGQDPQISSSFVFRPSLSKENQPEYKRAVNRKHEGSSGHLPAQAQGRQNNSSAHASSREYPLPIPFGPKDDTFARRHSNAMRRRGGQDGGQRTSPGGKVIGWVFVAIFVLGAVIIGVIVISGLIRAPQERLIECQTLAGGIPFELLPLDCQEILSKQ